MTITIFHELLSKQQNSSTMSSFTSSKKKKKKKIVTKKLTNYPQKKQTHKHTQTHTESATRREINALDMQTTPKKHQQNG
jgi:hypothetical protein